MQLMKVKEFHLAKGKFKKWISSSGFPSEINKVGWMSHNQLIDDDPVFTTPNNIQLFHIFTVRL